MAVKLFDYQLDAINNMKNGCILCGGVGSGKSLTAIAYYFVNEGGKVNTAKYSPMKDPPRDLYIITTARKRDTFEWDSELSRFLLSTHSDSNRYSNTVIVDSWNNIKKYANVCGAFFIFDEQRVVGSGAWVKAFLKIARRNRWILLSATPGDTWSDYIPVFIANGFFKNKTEFMTNHAVYSRTCKFPKIERFTDTGILLHYRSQILVNMEFKRDTISHHETVFVDYNIDLYKNITRKRWNPYTDAPIESPVELYLLWRKTVNSDNSRVVRLLEIFETHPKLIVFYNFDYELDILRAVNYGPGVDVSEWNGHKHQPLPGSDSWVYLVQYAAGCEGWNCIETDTIIFYSQNYSYKVMTQAAGRIDRLNTPYSDLYYYHFKSRSPIDLAISRALASKRNFNESHHYTSLTTKNRFL